LESDKTLGKRLIPQHTAAIVAHIDTICEATVSWNVERIVPVDPVAHIGADGERVSVAGSTASVARADDECTIRSRAAVKLVVIGALGLAGLYDCHTIAAFDVSTFGGWVRRDADGLVLGLGGRGDFGDFRAAPLEGRSQDEAGEHDEWEDEGGETHGVAV
jgi:hypothetical protein